MSSKWLYIIYTDDGASGCGGLTRVQGEWLGSFAKRLRGASAFEAELGKVFFFFGHKTREGLKLARVISG